MDNNENLIINFSFAVLIVGGEKIDYEIEQSSISEDSVKRSQSDRHLDLELNELGLRVEPDDEQFIDVDDESDDFDIMAVEEAEANLLEAQQPLIVI